MTCHAPSLSPDQGSAPACAKPRRHAGAAACIGAARPAGPLAGALPQAPTPRSPPARSILACDNACLCARSHNVTPRVSCCAIGCSRASHTAAENETHIFCGLHPQCTLVSAARGGSLEQNAYINPCITCTHAKRTCLQAHNMFRLCRAPPLCVRARGAHAHLRAAMRRAARQAVQADVAAEGRHARQRVRAQLAAVPARRERGGARPARQHAGALDALQRWLQRAELAAGAAERSARSARPPAGVQGALALACRGGYPAIQLNSMHKRPNISRSAPGSPPPPAPAPLSFARALPSSMPAACM